MRYYWEEIKYHFRRLKCLIKGKKICEYGIALEDEFFRTEECSRCGKIFKIEPLE